MKNIIKISLLLCMTCFANHINLSAQNNTKINDNKVDYFVRYYDGVIEDSLKNYYNDDNLLFRSLTFNFANGDEYIRIEDNYSYPSQNEVFGVQKWDNSYIVNTHGLYDSRRRVTYFETTRFRNGQFESGDRDEYIYEVYPEHDIIKDYYYTSKDNVDWDPFFRGYKKRNLKGKDLVNIFEEWNGTKWDTLWQHYYEYDKVGRKTYSKIIEYDFPVIEEVIEYNELGFKSRYEYREDGGIRIELIKVDNEKLIFTYKTYGAYRIEQFDSNKNLLSSTYQLSLNSSFISRTINNYNANNNIDLAVNEIWQNGVWVSDGAIKYEYDANNNLVKREYLSPDNRSSYTTEVWDYNSYNQLLKKERWHLETIVEPSGATVFYYAKTKYITNELPESIMEGSSAFEIFPNPTQDFIRIQILDPQFRESNVIIYEIGGTVVHEDKISSEQSELTLPNLVSGMYIVSLRNENEQASQKLFVN